MTTDTTRRAPAPASRRRVLLWSGLVGAVGGLVVYGPLPFVLGPTMLGLTLGVVAATVTVLTGGALAMDLVARVLPAASLLVAMLTYLMQVLLLGLVFIVLGRSGTVDGDAERAVVGVPVIAVVLCWTFTHLLLTVRDRIPVYDLPDTAEEGPAGLPGDARDDAGGRLAAGPSGTPVRGRGGE